MTKADRIPLIDVAPLVAGDVAGTAKVAAEIGAACRDVGFLYVQGHGVDQRLVADTLPWRTPSSRSRQR